jgi:hypothetical protein
LSLTTAEADAILGLDVPALEQFVNTLDERLQKVSLHDLQDPSAA